MATLSTSTTAVQFIQRSRLRKSFVVQNEDAAIATFIKRESPSGVTVSSTDHDHRLGPGSSLALNFGTDGTEAIQDRWTVIAASGTPLISFFETEDIVR
mgnify:CR=1 FL=1